MSLTLNIRPAASHLHASIAGAFDAQQFKDIYVRVIDTVHERGVDKIVLDYLNVTNDPPWEVKLEVYTFAKNYRFEALLAGKNAAYRVAAVAPYNFGQTRKKIAHDPNLFAVFERVEDAEEWLGIDA